MFGRPITADMGIGGVEAIGVIVVRIREDARGRTCEYVKGDTGPNSGYLQEDEGDGQGMAFWSHCSVSDEATLDMLFLLDYFWLGYHDVNDYGMEGFKLS